MSAKVVAALVVVVLGSGGMVVWVVNRGPERSVEAYCDVWREEATELHDGYEEAIDEDPFSALLLGIGAAEDMAVLLDKLARVAPDEIVSEVEALRDSLREQSSQQSEMISDPLGALGASMITALSSSGSYAAVDEYTLDNCGPPPYK